MHRNTLDFQFHRKNLSLFHMDYSFPQFHTFPSFIISCVSQTKYLKLISIMLQHRDTGLEINSAYFASKVYINM